MVYCLSRSQPPFSSRRRKMSDGPDRPVVTTKNRWAERESNPHSQRRLIYSQRSSPHCSICPGHTDFRAFACGGPPPQNQHVDERTLRIAVLLSAHVIFLSAAALRIIRGQRGHELVASAPSAIT